MARRIINGDQLMADLRDVFFMREAEWMSLTELVADLKVQPYAAYHANAFFEASLKSRLQDFGIRLTRRGLDLGVAWADLEGLVRKFAPGRPGPVRLAKKKEEVS